MSFHVISLTLKVKTLGVNNLIVIIVLKYANKTKNNQQKYFISKFDILRKHPCFDHPLRV